MIHRQTQRRTAGFLLWALLLGAVLPGLAGLSIPSPALAACGPNGCATDGGGLSRGLGDALGGLLKNPLMMILLVMLLSQLFQGGATPQQDPAAEEQPARAPSDPARRFRSGTRPGTDGESGTPTPSPIQTPNPAMFQGGATPQQDPAAEEQPAAPDVSRDATRDAAHWPFASDSPWNTALGSAADYATIMSPKFSPAKGANLNVSSWSIPVYTALPTDPWRSFFDVDAPTKIIATLRAPTNAAPDAQADGTLAVIDGAQAVEMWQARKLANGNWTASAAVLTDLTGPGFYDSYHGIRAGGMSALGGLIRRDELLALNIPHALAIAVQPAALNRNAPGGKAWVWPASWADGTTNPGGSYGTGGNLYMGSLLAIPPSVRLDTLGLSSQGLAIAQALQDYGAYISETGGGNVIYYAEPASADIVTTDGGELGKLTPYLKVITNNTAVGIGGGGVRRVDPAPPFDIAPPP